MDFAERFGATITTAGPDPEQESFFLVKRKPAVDHDEFMEHLVRSIGDVDRILFHHRDGLAVILVAQETAKGLRSHPMCALVGGVNVDIEKLQSILGSEPM